MNVPCSGDILRVSGVTTVQEHYTITRGPAQIRALALFVNRLDAEVIARSADRTRDRCETSRRDHLRNAPRAVASSSR